MALCSLLSCKGLKSQIFLLPRKNRRVCFFWHADAHFSSHVYFCCHAYFRCHAWFCHHAYFNCHPYFNFPLWSRFIENKDWNTGPLARPFVRSLAPLTRLLAPHCSLCLRAPLCSLVCLLAHFAYSIACRTVNDWLAIYPVFFFYFGP